MKKILTLTTLIFTLISCTKEKVVDQATEENADDISETHNQALKSEDGHFLDEFDWSKIPTSTAEIGSFPYITAPDGFIVLQKGKKSMSKDGMTVFSDYGKLISYNGEYFFDSEGKKAELNFGMEQSKSDFNQFKFDKSVDDYLQSLAAMQLFKGQIPREKIDKLNDIDKGTAYNFIIGDVWNKNPVSHYALNHANGKVIFQVWSNSAQSKIGVIEIEGFKQTIKAPTASEMKASLDLTGKAILYINFDVDKATLKPDGQKLVDEIGTLLNSNPELKLLIEGHTDNTGTENRNLQLSTERANTVMYSLAGKGINIERLKAKGYGSEKPIVANDTDENRAQNRRVELVKF
ncbi:OmpA family protein [Pararhodonellum marinum]|uniref:OmpA family protein n=1 Tax=Pararhodonellum marinum TaxID=2755358 RepID=UPI00188E3F7D|nr:OmpA family protein [Pararhodonellum marinum]